MAAIQDLLEKTVNVITNDGRVIIGVLKGFDQILNIILEQTHERIFSPDKGVIQNVLGLYLIRGDNVAIIGEFDEALDATFDLSTLKANPLKPVTH